MDREVKFRAWHKKREKMYKVATLGIHYIRPTGNKSVVGRENVVDMLIPREEVALMQFTGLTDANGTEIYEGDIMGGSTATGSCRVYFGKNEFDHRPYAWCIEWTDSKSTGFLDASICSLTVVGNIYEDPELLREEESH